MPITTPKPTTAPPSISCTTCSGLRCLLGSYVTLCPAGQSFCMTTVTETGTGRQISRGCASQTACVDFNQNEDSAVCSQVDHQMLPSGTQCHFCCTGDNCNKPPHVRPDASSLFP
ncbi:uncharacterized protein LOC143298519 [Babylonia areolata]|uniref:uncharacterized protein LOC143298519 n=1 Tax=Babylonia areolata TaxID=304850 RepID=UPI003FD5F609